LILLTAVIGTGCATSLTKATYERKCDRIETSWDAETEKTIIVEYGCVVTEPAKERQTWMLVFQIIGAIVGIAALVL
jgi:triosephosphate isomerase